MTLTFNVSITVTSFCYATLFHDLTKIPLKHTLWG